MVPIVYHSKYNITAFGLERLHPFDSVKYRRIHDWLIGQGLRKRAEFVHPKPSENSELELIHPPEYLSSLRSRTVLARILEVPIVRLLPSWLLAWRILKPMRWATGGTLLTCRLALGKGLAINLGGGFHHAGPNRGGGFCAFADVPLALAILKEEELVTSVLVVDTDAHQGNGTADAIRPWSWAHILDFFEEDIFPWPKVQEDMPVPLPPGTRGAEYLDALREHLPKVLEQLRPGLVVYNAGSDVLDNDPLSRFSLTTNEMAERDCFVVTETRDRRIPLAIVLSGGYGPLSWQAHAQSIEGILTRFDKTI